MNLRSTKKGLPNSTRQFRETADVRTIGSFKGAVESAFGDRINSRWRFLGTRFFKPVRLDFRTHTNPFELANWPRLPQAKPARFVFSPTIHLTCRFNQTTNVFFESAAECKFQWFVDALRVQRVGGAQLPTTPLARGLWTCVRKFRYDSKEPVQGEGNGALILRQESWLVRTLARGGCGRGVQSSVRATPDFFTILHTMQYWAQALKETISQLAVWPRQLEHLRDKQALRETTRALTIWPRQAEPSVDTQALREIINTPAVRPRQMESLGHNGISKSEKLFVLLRSVLDRGNTVSAMTSLQAALKMRIVNAVTLRQGYFTQLTLPGSRQQLASAGNLIVRASLALASKPVDSARRNQSFSTSTVLTYASRESPQAQAMVSALRELRPSPSEVKTAVAHPLPSIEHLTNQVRQQLERELRIEKERRGL